MSTCLTHETSLWLPILRFIIKMHFPVQNLFSFLRLWFEELMDYWLNCTRHVPESQEVSSILLTMRPQLWNEILNEVIQCVDVQTKVKDFSF